MDQRWRTCRRKKVFKSAAAARKWYRQRESSSLRKLHPYKCPCCSRYHLTHHSPQAQAERSLTG